MTDNWKGNSSNLMQMNSTEINSDSNNKIFINNIKFFKNDIEKELLKLENKINFQNNIINFEVKKKLETFSSKIEDISKKMDNYSSTIDKKIVEMNYYSERFESLTKSKQKMEQEFTNFKYKLKFTSEELTQSIQKYDKLILDSLMYPTTLGIKYKFNNFKDFIDYIIKAAESSKIYKENNLLEMQHYKSKLDNLILRLDVQLQNIYEASNTFIVQIKHDIEKQIISEFNSLSDKFLKLKNQSEDLEKDINKINEKITEQDNKNEEFNNNLNSLITSVEEIKSFNNDIQKLVSDNKEEIGGIKINYNSLNKKIDDIEKEKQNFYKYETIPLVGENNKLKYHLNRGRIYDTASEIGKITLSKEGFNQFNTYRDNDIKFKYENNFIDNRFRRKRRIGSVDYTAEGFQYEKDFPYYHNSYMYNTLYLKEKRSPVLYPRNSIDITSTQDNYDDNFIKQIKVIHLSYNNLNKNDRRPLSEKNSPKGKNGRQNLDLIDGKIKKTSYKNNIKKKLFNKENENNNMIKDFKNGFQSYQTKLPLLKSLSNLNALIQDNKSEQKRIKIENKEKTKKEGKKNEKIMNYRKQDYHSLFSLKFLNFKETNRKKHFSKKIERIKKLTRNKNFHICSNSSLNNN